MTQLAQLLKKTFSLTTMSISAALFFVFLVGSTAVANNQGSDSGGEGNTICPLLMIEGDVKFTSPAMVSLLNQRVAKVAGTNTTVLLLGPSGSGKDVLARIVHNSSKRKDKKMHVFNMSTLSGEMAKVALFGYKAGSFTGSGRTDQPGMFESADGSTIFLDEIGDMQPELQADLLRVIQEGEVQRVGDSQVRKVNVRIIAATNQNLYELVKQKKFREDLYYRLRVFTIEIPWLKDRREEIIPIAESYRAQLAKLNEKDVPGFTPEAIAKLTKYAYPGNVRELKDMIESAVVLADEGKPIAADMIYVEGDQAGGNADVEGSDRRHGLSPRDIDQVKSQVVFLNYTTNIAALQKAAILQALLAAPLSDTGLRANSTQLNWAADRIGYRPQTFNWNINHSTASDMYKTFLKKIDEMKMASRSELNLEEVRGHFVDDAEISLFLSLPLETFNIEELERQAIRRVVLHSQDRKLFSSRSATPDNPSGLSISFVARELGYFDNSITFLNLVKKLGMDMNELIKEREAKGLN